MLSHLYSKDLTACSTRRALYVAFRSKGVFALLQSRLHEVWARFYRLIT